jgi:hypothetical protein
MEEVRERSKSDDIIKKIDSGDFIELSGDDAHLKSTAYNGFLLLYEKGDTSSYMGYIKCKCCSKLIKHSVHGSGTSHLTRHSSTHSVDGKHDSVRTQSKMTSFLVPKKKLNAHDSQEFMSALTYFCARDMC